MKLRQSLLLAGVLAFTTACSDPEPPILARSAGFPNSTGKPHYSPAMAITDILGGGGNWHGYAQTTIPNGQRYARVSIPKRIHGWWTLGWMCRPDSIEEPAGVNGREFPTECYRERIRWPAEWGDRDDPANRKWYYIDAEIDVELAAKKVETLNNYFNKYFNNESIKGGRPSLVPLIDGDKIYLYYSLGCGVHEGLGDSIDACKARPNADPNGWVVHDPCTNLPDKPESYERCLASRTVGSEAERKRDERGTTRAVLLFEGKGELSEKPEHLWQ